MIPFPPLRGLPKGKGKVGIISTSKFPVPAAAAASFRVSHEEDVQDEVTPFCWIRGEKMKLRTEHCVCVCGEVPEHPAGEQGAHPGRTGLALETWKELQSLTGPTLTAWGLLHEFLTA